MIPLRRCSRWRRILPATLELATDQDRGDDDNQDNQANGVCVE